MTTPASTSSPGIAPVQQSERIWIIDSLRGFALFGILLVNMIIFARPIQTIVLPIDPAMPPVDRAAEWFIHFFGEGKFYSMFSLLFGLGLTLLMDRVESRGGRFVPLYLRRLLILLGIGLVHALLIWVGDILIMYAVIGSLLVLFRKAKPRTLLIWAIILIALPLLFNTAATAFVEFGRSIPEASEQIDQAFAQVEEGYAADVERGYRVYPSGTFAEITRQRMYDYSSMGLTSFLVLGFNVLAMFLVGVWFGKKQIFQDLEASRPLFTKLLIWGLIVGIPANAVYATLIMPLSRVATSWTLIIATASQTIGAPLLSLAFISAIALLARRPGWGNRIQVLAPVGQMALSNYLTQSIVCTLIFYGYGLGLFGKVGAAAGVGLTVVIYLLQIPISHWWMKRFKYGPAEWLWRSLTYLRLQPMRKT